MEDELIYSIFEVYLAEENKEELIDSLQRVITKFNLSELTNSKFNKKLMENSNINVNSNKEFSLKIVENKIFQSNNANGNSDKDKNLTINYVKWIENNRGDFFEEEFGIAIFLIKNNDQEFISVLKEIKQFQVF